jgi:fermentation-respiration switch protein FrsA (DUF1100 family)
MMQPRAPQYRKFNSKRRTAARFSLRCSLGGLLLIAFLIGGYPLMINWFAFFPDRHNPLTGANVPDGVSELFIDTADGKRLHCYWLAQPDADRVLIFFHGNAGHIGHRLDELRALADLGLNVLGVGYRGFGLSTGRPSEKGIFADGRAVLAYVTEQRGFDLERVLLLGRSIGSTVAVEIGQGKALGGIILVTPLTSGKAIARSHGFGPLAFFAGDKFNNLNKIEQIKAPLLIIHGTRDDITPYAMGLTLFEQAPEPKRMVTIEGGGHNDIGLPGQEAFYAPIRKFLSAAPPEPAPVQDVPSAVGR